MKKVISVLSILALACIAKASSPINMDMVTVGNAGNAADTTRLQPGAVSYEYRIGKYEVTNAQYATFSNSVFATQSGTYANYTNGTKSVNLYAALNYSNCGIAYDATDGFIPREGQENNAVNYISAYASALFCNWLGDGDITTGAYNINLADKEDMFYSGNINREAGYVLPTDNEWYKAAYYNGDTETYSMYANGKDTITTEDANYNNVIGAITDVDYGVASFYGTYGQTGNLNERNETLDGSFLRYRGGAYSTTDLIDISSDKYGNVNNSNTSRIIGFRVATLDMNVPEPATYAAIFGALALGFAAWRKRK